MLKGNQLRESTLEINFPKQPSASLRKVAIFTSHNISIETNCLHNDSVPSPTKKKKKIMENAQDCQHKPSM